MSGATLVQGFEREAKPGTTRVKEPALARSSMSHWRGDLDVRATQMRLNHLCAASGQVKRIQNLGLRSSEPVMASKVGSIP